MNSLVTSKLLGIPVIIWIAQVAYVIIALGVLLILLNVLKPKSVSFIVIYIIGMIIIDVVWRLIVGHYVR